ncbi:hypothetical protein [Pseudomonas frederiksbergensis]|uniref:hypothetical protein n=1 Tax=Pseudomonas frederiksbergensis TaxID=104087 RepID=UPI00218201C4|nr:hypothetical protein [Pseudomonas frederiksbergensis]
MTSVEEFIALSNRITMEYEAIVPLLSDPEVVKAAKFLAELDKLAREYDFSSLDIMTLVDPGRALQLDKSKAVKPAKTQKRSKRTVQQ